MLSSTFTWLDYSEEHRRQVLDVLSAFAEPDTVDELGLSHIRDGIADILFPGTSTIQRGARYFLFVPWSYLELERKKVPSAEIAKKARLAEVTLIDSLLKSGEMAGVIGNRAGSRLKRLPSAIYWQGLAKWGIRVYPGSQEQYHRSLDDFYRKNQTVAASKDDDGGYASGSPLTNWHRGVPPAPKGFPAGANLRLTKSESQYLQERILSTQPTSMLARLVTRESPLPHQDFPWQAEGVEHMSAAIQEVLRHARNCSELLHGASLLYNLMLSEKVNNGDLTDAYRKDLAKWSRQIEASFVALVNWDRDRLWQILAEKASPVPLPTRHFVSQWFDIVISAESAHQIPEDRKARDLITLREVRLKGKVARLRNPSALDRWHGASGAHQLRYRWGNAMAIGDDIHNGLRDPHA